MNAPTTGTRRVPVGPDLPGFLVAAAFDWAVIAGGFVAISQLGAWAMIPAMLIIGARQHALAVLGHEVAHRLAAKNRTINDWLGNVLCYWPTLMSLPAYRAFHFEHHRFVGNERDPESVSWSMAGYQKPRDRRELARRLVADLVGLRLGDLVALQRSIGPRSLQERLPIAVFAVTTTVVFVLLSLWWVPIVWMVALALPAHACFRLRALHEHTYHGGTYLASCGVVGRFLFFPHNTWCHAEHHETAGVAARWLPRLRAADTQVTPWYRVFRPGERAAVAGLVAPKTCPATTTLERSA